MKKNFYKHKIERLICIESIVTVHYFEYPKNYKFEGESHDFWEMLYVDKGCVLCSRNKEKEFEVKQGQIIFHKPNEFHTVRVDKDKEGAVFIISFASKSLILNFFEKGFFIPDLRQKKMLKNIMEEASNTFQMSLFEPSLTKLALKPTPSLGGLQVLKNYLEIFLINFLRNKDTNSNTYFLNAETLNEGLVKAIIKYLENNLYNNLKLDDLCNNFNYGKTYICTIFKKQTGKTIFKFFNQLKISEAKRLMRTSELSFHEIAYKLGFDSYSYFVKTFKKLTNYLPREYIKLLKY